MGTLPLSVFLVVVVATIGQCQNARELSKRIMNIGERDNYGAIKRQGYESQDENRYNGQNYASPDQAQLQFQPEINPHQVSASHNHFVSVPAFPVHGPQHIPFQQNFGGYGPVGGQFNHQNFNSFQGPGLYGNINQNGYGAINDFKHGLESNYGKFKPFQIGEYIPIDYVKKGFAQKGQNFGRIKSNYVSNYKYKKPTGFKSGGYLPKQYKSNVHQLPGLKTADLIPATKTVKTHVQKPINNNLEQFNNGYDPNDIKINGIPLKEYTLRENQKLTNKPNDIYSSFYNPGVFESTLSKPNEPVNILSTVYKPNDHLPGVNALGKYVPPKEQHGSNGQSVKSAPNIYQASYTQSGNGLTHSTGQDFETHQFNKGSHDGPYSYVKVKNGDHSYLYEIKHVVTKHVTHH